MQKLGSHETVKRFLLLAMSVVSKPLRFYVWPAFLISSWFGSQYYLRYRNTIVLLDFQQSLNSKSWYRTR